MDIEQLATSAIETSISKVDKLKAYVGANEKGPSYDGYIGIFSDNNFSKKNFKRINIQVKGKKVKQLPNKQTFPISVIDLNNYKNLGGSIYFVVYIGENGDILDIYYVSLLPFNINEILDGKENNKTISVSLKQFPKENNQKYELIINFFADSQKQSNFVNIAPLDFGELQKSGNLESLSISYTPVGTEHTYSEFPFFMEGKEVYIYAKTKGNPLPIPIQHIYEVEHIQGNDTIEMPIFVRNEKFYDSYKIIYLKDKTITKLGNSFTLTADTKNKKLNYKIKVKGTLKQQINDLKFIISLLKHNEFKFGDCIFPINSDEMDNKSEYLDTLEKQLEYFNEILILLNKLNVKKDLDIENFSDEDSNRVEILKDAILYNKITTAFESQPPIVAKFGISNIVLLLFFIQEENGIKICDFFQTHGKVIVKDSNGNEYEVSQFDTIDKDLILQCDNIDYLSIVNDFKSKPISEVLLEFANNVMLQMLLAYDVCHNDDLMNAIIIFSDWIDANPEYLSSYVSRINQLQILARVRKLSIEEKSELMDIYNNTESNDLKVGCLLLMGETETAMKMFQEFPIETQEIFKKYPIWHFAENANS